MLRGQQDANQARRQRTTCLSSRSRSAGCSTTASLRQRMVLCTSTGLSPSFLVRFRLYDDLLSPYSTSQLFGVSIGCYYSPPPRHWSCQPSSHISPPTHQPLSQSSFVPHTKNLPTDAIRTTNAGHSLGASSAAQLEENCKASEKGPLPDEVVNALDEAYQIVLRHGGEPPYWR